MLLQSHNIPAHLFSHQFVPSNSRWHLHRNLYYIYHIDNRTQKYLPGTNRWEKGLLNSYNLFAQLYSIQHYTTFPRTSFPNDLYLENRVGIHIVTCTASITSTTSHKSICQQQSLWKRLPAIIQPLRATLFCATLVHHSAGTYHWTIISWHAATFPVTLFGGTIQTTLIHQGPQTQLFASSE